MALQPVDSAQIVLFGAELTHAYAITRRASLKGVSRYSTGA